MYLFSIIRGHNAKYLAYKILKYKVRNTNPVKSEIPKQLSIFKDSS